MAVRSWARYIGIAQGPVSYFGSATDNQRYLRTATQLHAFGWQPWSIPAIRSLVRLPRQKRRWKRRTNTFLKIAAETTGLFINIDLAILLGLLISELIICAYKRSFPPDQRGIVSISLDVQRDRKMQLVIAENGIQKPDTPLHCTAIGEQIIAQLIGHIGADMTTQQHEGTRTTVTFPYHTNGGWRLPLEEF
jgi:hypothetical protein